MAAVAAASGETLAQWAEAVADLAGAAPPAEVTLEEEELSDDDWLAHWEGPS